MFSKNATFYSSVVSDGGVAGVARDSRHGCLSAWMYFLTVSLWMPHSIGYHPGQLHTCRQVPDLVYPLGEVKGFKFLAWIPARPGQFFDDVSQCRQPNVISDVATGVNPMGHSSIAHHLHQ